jgi:hypothetical protein
LPPIPLRSKPPTGARDGTVMPAGTNAPRLEKVTRKWLDLAERRLASYEELYRSGRWALYYPTQELFAVRMLDVIKAVKTLRRAAEHVPERPRISRLRQAA